jgi:bacteriorhodopsin
MDMTVMQYDIVYNSFSFAIAVMGAATVFLFLGRSQVAHHYKTAVTISGLVTLIAFYHYWRIFDSWEAAYNVANGAVTATAHRFNDAYRYVDWLLTVPLLLTELVLVMRLSREETVQRASHLAKLAAVMILLGYPGEISNDNETRWMWWALSMIPFLMIVWNLFTGLSKSIASQPESVRELISMARLIVVVTWAFYPIVYMFPMLGVSGGKAAMFVQVGYTIADILAKAAFGVYIWLIAVRKSEENK